MAFDPPDPSRLSRRLSGAGPDDGSGDGAGGDPVSRRLVLLSADLAAAAPDEHTHVRPPDAPTRPGSEWGEEAPVVATPGRHAARRRTAPMSAAPRSAAPTPATDLRGAGPSLRWLPDTLRGRARWGAPQLAVLSVVVALGLLATAWWTVRSRSTGELVPAVPAPALTAAASPVAFATTPGGAAVRSGAATPSASASPGGTVVVDVTGKVRRPGIVVLPTGSRVVDALRRAGGVRPRVDLTGLNQARVLVDGEQIVVGQATAPGVAAAAVSSASSTGATTPGALVDLNTADESGLESLPGVGPVTAGKILAYRTANGGFTSVDQLLEVDGIGEKTLADLAPLVTI